MGRVGSENEVKLAHGAKYLGNPSEGCSCTLGCL